MRIAQSKTKIILITAFVILIGSNVTEAYIRTLGANKQVQCKRLVGNGDFKKKINFFFVAEKFTDKNEFINEMKTYLGLIGNDPLSLFQYAPFSEFKDSYTVRYQFIPNKDYECASSNTVVTNDQRFCFNNTVALQTLASSCGESAYETDFIIVLSKNSFRSSADVYTLEEIDPRTRIMRLSIPSLPEDTPPEKIDVLTERLLTPHKKVVLHEFGHVLGSLSDEYITYDKEGYKPIAGTSAANIDTAGCPKWSSGHLNTSAPHYSDYLDYQSCVANLNPADSQDDDKFIACYASVPPEAFEQDFGQDSDVGSGCFWGAGAMNGFRSVQTSIMRDPNYAELGPVNERIARAGIRRIVAGRNMPMNNLSITPREIRLIKTTSDIGGLSKQYLFRLEFDVLNQQKKPVLIKINRHNYDLSVNVDDRPRSAVIIRNMTHNNYYAFYDHMVSIKDRPDLNLLPSDEVTMTINAIYNKANTTKNLKINLTNLRITILPSRNR